jgi:hypothetical protein
MQNGQLHDVAYATVLHPGQALSRPLYEALGHSNLSVSASQVTSFLFPQGLTSH